MKSRIGTTQGNYIQFLSNAANLMPEAYGSNQTLFNLLQFESARTQAQLGHSVSGIVTSSDPQVKLAGRRLTIFDASNDVTIPAVILNDGSFFFANVPDGTYAFRPEGFLLAGNPTVTVQNGQAVTGVHLTATRGVRVSGYVTSFDGFALNNAVVRLQSGVQTFKTRTDSTGAYLLEGIPAGTYRIIASANGYADYYSTSIAIGTNGLVRNIAMTTEAIISGHVVFNGGTPASGSLSVLVTSLNGLTGFSTSASVLNNQYTINALPAGSYRIKFSFPGYNDVFVQNVNVVAGQVLVLPDVTMVSTASLRGTVTSTVAASPAANATVAIYDGNNQLLSSMQTDANGNFGLDKVAPGDYRLQVVGLTSGISNPYFITIAPGDHPTGILLQITAGATVNGVATFQGSGLPLIRQGVVLTTPAGGRLSAITDENGNYHFESLAAGTYVVSLSTAGNDATASQSVTVLGNAGETVTANLSRAPSLARVTGTITTSTGDPLANVGVFAYINGQPVLSGYTDANGQYSMDFDQTGTFDLVAIGDQGTFTRQTGIVIASGNQLTINFVAGTASWDLSLSASGEQDDLIDYVIYQVMGNDDFRAMLFGDSMGLSGTVHLDNLTPGTYRIEATSVNHQGLSTIVTLGNGANQSSFALGTMSTLQGTIYGPDGAPLPFAKVALNGPDNRFVVTDADYNGDYDFDYLPSGNYQLTILSDGYVAKKVSNVMVNGDSTQDAQLASNDGTTLTGYLLDGQGRPVAGIPMLLTQADGTVLGFVRSGFDGSFTITTAGASTNLKLSITGGSGYGPITLTNLTLAAGATLNVGNQTLQSVGLGSIPPAPVAPAPSSVGNRLHYPSAG
ncbi:MAG: carboxypeptidase-like regulatory domain-containing protein [Gemmatales bacterium]